MGAGPIIAIFPYLKTSGVVAIRGIPFRSSTDIAEWPRDVQQHLRTLFRMFLMRDNQRIAKMTYTCWTSTDDHDATLSFYRRLYEAHSIVAYLYASPHHSTGDPTLHLEHASLYVLSPDRVFSSTADLEHGLVTNIRRRTASAKRAPTRTRSLSSRAGYTGLLDGTRYISLVAGEQVYPPAPNFWLNISQNLYGDVDRYTSEEHHWAIRDLMAASSSTWPEVEERVFTALDWYNMSSGLMVTEAAALVQLAIAFECLLGLETGKGVTDRFKETILVLLGPVPRLDSWLDQFYGARSNIAHDGFSPNLMFYAVERGGVSKAVRGQEQAIAYRPLIMYARHIFRLCVNAILTGAKLAENARLAALLVHNQQRLETICQRLSHSEKGAEQRLRSVAQDVIDLNTYAFDAPQHVRIETVLGAAKYIVETYLETKPQLPEALHQAMRNPQLDAHAMEVSDDYLTALHEAIDAWRGPQRYISFGSQPELIDIVSAFLQYCEHALRDWRIRQWQMSRSATRQAAEPANNGVAAKEQTTDNMTHDRDL